MPNIVTERFIKCHDYLKSNKLIKSSRQFALELDFLPQSLSEILKKRRDVTIELIRKAVDRFEFNPAFIFTGNGPMFKKHGHDSEMKVLTVVSNKYNKQQIIHVPVMAQASYANETLTKDLIKQLPTFSLPDYRYDVGIHRSFDVGGDAMEPTVFEGDKVVCTFVEPEFWANALRFNHVYVVVTDSDVLVRRLQSKINQDGSIRLICDNDFYETSTIPVGKVREIWHVRVKISPFLQAPSRKLDPQFEREFEGLKQLLFQQTEMISVLNKKINKLSD
jgi:phage repressor protein C with HTH and peptisase S24 domain